MQKSRAMVCMKTQGDSETKMDRGISFQSNATTSSWKKFWSLTLAFCFFAHSYSTL